jgi:trimeric autotransporter adhesin
VLVQQQHGIASHAEGNITTASGHYSHAEGLGTIAYENYQLAIGKYNTTGNADQLFIIGKGTSYSVRSNAFRVNNTGEVYGAGASYNTGADYAEYFESLLGDSLSSGTVVELVDDKIKVCEDANNAIGVISATPTVVGNCEDGTSDEWVGKYEKDIWGKTIYEDYTYEIPISIDENGETIYKTKTSQQPKIHPNYNPDIIYIPRSKRPEWNIVGLMGQIKVLKNQQIPTRWIKMKDINDEIALYLVK